MAVGSKSWVVVLETRDQRQCNEAGLVLTALEIEYELSRLDGRWVISVPAELASEASEELAAYAAEKHAAPVGAKRLVELSDGWSGVVAYVSVLLAIGTIFYI